MRSLVFTEILQQVLQNLVIDINLPISGDSFRILYWYWSPIRIFSREQVQLCCFRLASLWQNDKQWLAGTLPLKWSCSWLSHKHKWIV